jgi:hypothetical protein
MDLVRLTIVPNEPAAEEIVALLRTEGIESIERKTDFGVGTTDAFAVGSGAREVLVSPKDIDAARALIGESQ